MTAQPGWYPDQQIQGQLRYWDGHRWTEHRVTAPTQIPRSSTSWPRRHPLWSALLTVLVVVLFIGAVTDQDTPDSAATSDSVAPDRESSPAKTSPEPETKVDDPGPTPAEVTAPGLVGQPLKRARANLARSSLGVQVERRVSAKRPGTVLQQSIKPGSQLLPGAAVLVVVSAPWPRVPNVTGISAKAATSRLTKAGFRVVKREQRVTSGRDRVVLSQATPAGKIAKPRSRVRVTIADLRKPPSPTPRIKLHGRVQPLPRTHERLRLCRRLGKWAGLREWTHQGVRL